MAESDTWLMGDDPRMPVGQVAVDMLRNRFDAVWRELRAAVAVPAQVEHIHQLRVATRRTLAAIDVFRPVMPAKRRAWFEKRLRRLRRVAGEARDLDVLAIRLSGNATVTARHRLVSLLTNKRRASRTPIRAEFDDLVAVGWPTRVDRLLADTHGRQSRAQFRDFARRRFKPMVKAFFEKAGRKLRDDEGIHMLRIEGKKLRYALEIFGAVFPPDDRDRCRESLERLQRTLGDFVDHASAADRLARWAHNADAGPDRDLLVALRDDETRQAARARRSFSKWWNPARRRSLRRRFRRTLRQAA